MTWINTYRFTLTHPTAGARIVAPIIADLVVEGVQERRFIWRKQIATPLLFTEGDFTWLYAIETGPDRCEKIAIAVETKCAGVWASFYDGYITTEDGEWDADNCRVSLRVSVDDAYTCVFEGWREEKNIFNASGLYTAKERFGSVQEIECVAEVVNASLAFIPEANGCLPDLNEWSIIENEFIGSVEEAPGIWAGSVRSVWVRERVTGSPGMPPGNGWVSLGAGEWVRKLVTEGFEETINYEVPSVLQIWELSADLEFDNAKQLKNILEYFNPCAGTYTIRSDFFRINAGVLPATAPYNAAAGGFDQILVWQKSDIVRPNVDYNASKGITTFEKLLGFLANTFNTAWRIEGGAIRIEHISYFEGDDGLDLTAPPFLAQIERKNRYQYTRAQKPRYERFAWMDNVTPYFAGQNIAFNNACSQSQDAAEQFYRVEEVSTDLAYMAGNTDEVSLQGFAFGAAYLSGGIYYLNTEGARLNGHLAFTRLHPAYWTYSRPQGSGTMNGAPTVFDSTVPSKTQEALAVVMECNVFASFEPELRVQSLIGWGEASAWTYSAKNCLLTIELIHE